MKIHITILLSVLSAATIAAHPVAPSDTINRTVLVESTYNPIIAGAVKRNFIPEIIEPSMKKETIVYAADGQPITRFERIPDAVKAADIAPEKLLPGYLHLGYGNYNNFSGLAAYTFHPGTNNSLSLNGHATGWDGKYSTPYADSPWRTYMRDMGVDATYSLHMGCADLSVGLSGVNYAYNYLANEYFTGDTDKQLANRLQGNISLQGRMAGRFSYRLHSAYTHFGRNSMLGQSLHNSEGHLHSGASLSADLSGWGIATVALYSDLLRYQGLESYQGYHAWGVNPRWDYRHGDFRLVAGAHLDFLSQGHTATLQASPDCKVYYLPASAFSAVLTIDGGRELPTFSALHTRSPYWAVYEQPHSSYTYVNAHLAGNLRIAEGLHLHLGAGYKVVDNALFETPYCYIDDMAFTGILNNDTHQAYADTRLSYRYKDLLNLSAELAYNHWMLQGDYSPLLRMPQLDSRLHARVRILQGLHLTTAYRYVMFTQLDGQDTHELPINHWDLGLHYAMSDGLSFFLDGHNLLNRHYQYYAGYPSQGINVLAGFVFKF